MAQDALLKAIEDDALAEKAVLLKEAEEAARATLQQAHDESAAWKEQRTAVLKKAFVGKKAALIGSARVRASAVKLRLRQALVKEVMKEAAKLLEAMGKNGREALLNRFYNELKTEWEKTGLGLGNVPIVLVNPADVDLVKPEGAEVKGDTGISLGVVFISKDGKTRFENTVSGRMRKAEKMLSAGADKILFSNERLK